jgi:hypothetical protein
MALFLGGEKNIYQKDDHGDEMGEMDEMSFYKRMKISILFQSTDIKKS